MPFCLLPHAYIGLLFGDYLRLSFPECWVTLLLSIWNLPSYLLLSFVDDLYFQVCILVLCLPVPLLPAFRLTPPPQFASIWGVKLVSKYTGMTSLDCQCHISTPTCFYLGVDLCVHSHTCIPTSSFQTSLTSFYLYCQRCLSTFPGVSVFTSPLLGKCLVGSDHWPTPDCLPQPGRQAKLLGSSPENPCLYRDFFLVGREFFTLFPCWGGFWYSKASVPHLSVLLKFGSSFR